MCMVTIETIKGRHSVRRYLPKPISEETKQQLLQEIAACNEQSGLHIQLVTQEPKAFTGLLSYGKFSGVENYLVMAGRPSESFEERVGRYGEHLVLFAQSLGLNTCWVGMSYRKVNDAFTLLDGEKVRCVIAIGYGETQGHSHKIKAVSQVSNATESSPTWFVQGVEAALLAPTAINQQKFRFELQPQQGEAKPVVKAKTTFSMVGYTKIDLGIAKLHFEIGAGKDNFVWE